MRKNILATAAILALISFAGCMPRGNWAKERLIPAEEFSRSAKSGHLADYSIFHAEEEAEKRDEANAEAIPAAQAGLSRASLGDAEGATLVPATSGVARNIGDPRYIEQGFKLRKSVSAPQTEFVSDGDVAPADASKAHGQPPHPPHLPALPPGSSSPYSNGQMTANPSLWPDESQGANLFTDFRAFQAMDVITIQVNESSVGSKKTKSDAEGKYSILASIANFLGLETRWKSNNEGLDPTALIQANTDSKFEGKGEMTRSGNLKAELSAVIMEVLPNGLMRIEGSKIVSVDDEEEVMVISGLVRSRDINSSNQVDSNRVANMRIDFYGRGVLAQTQTPGWGARLFSTIWPF